MSFAMVSLGCVVLLAATTGSYATAGLAAGALGLANVLVAPWRARFAARRGQKFGLRVLSLGFAAGCTALLVCATLRASALVLVLCAASAGGLAPPVGAVMRMRWRLLVPDPDQLARAYSLDAVSEELVFTLGPVIAGVLMAVTASQAALMASGLCAVVGCFVMTGGAAEPPPVQSSGGYFELRIFRTPGFTGLLLVLVATGTVIGAVDVIVPAHVAPNDALSGILLGAMALGSSIGGLVYGARMWPGSALRRLIVLAAAMAAACAGLASAPGVGGLGIGLVITGLMLAPAMVTGYLAVDAIIGDDDRLEAHTWINTAVNAGTAGASATTGTIIEHTTTGSAFLLTAGGAAVIITVGVLARRSSRA
jgi:MFS family permease